MSGHSETPERMQTPLLDTPPVHAHQGGTLHETVLEAMPDMACVFDPGLRLRYANHALLRALGMRREDVPGRTFQELGFAEWDAGLRDVGATAVFATGCTLRGDVRLRDTRGRRTMDCVLGPVPDSGGKVGAVLAVLRDVTQRSALEQSARRSERRLRAIASASSSVIYRMDPDWAGVQVLVGPDSDSPAPLSRLELVAAHLHPEDHARLTLAAERAREETTVFEAEYRWLRDDGRYHWLAARVVPVRGDDGRVQEWVGATTDVDVRRQQELHRQLLLDELNHRVKNTLAVVQSIAVQTLSADGGPAALERFQSRLLALAKAHELLTASHWTGTCLRDVVETAIGPGMGGGLERFSIDGPAVRLCPRQSLALSMALHELCTNAVKYGALSAPEGHVRIRWQRRADASGPRLRLEWQESGGPPVSAPTRRGFGTRLVERGLRHDLDGEVVLAFDRSGVMCRIDVPLVEDSPS